MNQNEINEIIKIQYPTADLTQLSNQLSLSPGAIKQRASKMGVCRQGQKSRGKMPYRTPEDKELISQTIRERYPLEGPASIAKLYGLSEVAIKCRAMELGVKFDREHGKRPRSKDPNFEAVAKMIKEIYPTEGPYPISTAFNLSIDAVYIRARRMGVKCNKPEWYFRTTQTKIQKFDTLDLSLWVPELTPIGSYFLGLAWTDGTIAYRTPDEAPKRQSTYHVTFGHSGQDREILDYLAEKLNLSPERVRKVKKYQERHQIPFHLKLCGRRIASLFQDHFDIPMQKSFTDPPFPKNIPDDRLSSFARGVFDGDGHAHRHPGYQFYGTNRFMEELWARLNSLIGVPKRPIHKCTGGKLRVFGIYAREDVERFTYFLHSDRFHTPNYPFIRRKHQKFLEEYTL